MNDLTELRDQFEAKIKDAYYAARDNGGTMHTAADDAVDAIMPLVDEAHREAKAEALREAATRIRTECRHHPEEIFCHARADDLDRWAEEIGADHE